MKSKFLKILFKYLNIRGLLFEGLLDGLVKEALDDMAKKTDNPYDDVAVAALYPPLSTALKNVVEKKLADLEAEAAAS